MGYIHKKLKYKLRKDLNIYNPKATESTFIEVINDKRLNTIIECIYKHPKTTINEFADNSMLPLLEKLSLVKKEIMLMGDFNINLLHSYLDKETSNFMDNIDSNFFFQESTYQLA